MLKNSLKIALQTNDWRRMTFKWLQTIIREWWWNWRRSIKMELCGENDGSFPLCLRCNKKIWIFDDVLKEFFRFYCFIWFVCTNLNKNWCFQLIYQLRKWILWMSINCPSTNGTCLDLNIYSIFSQRFQGNWLLFLLLFSSFLFVPGSREEQKTKIMSVYVEQWRKKERRNANRNSIMWRHQSSVIRGIDSPVVATSYTIFGR